MPGEKNGSNSTPNYIINIPLKIDSESDSNTSSGSDCDSDEYSTYVFKSPERHFRLIPNVKNNDKRGILLQKDYYPKQFNKNQPHQSKSLALQENLVKQFTEETFGNSAAESKIQAEKRLSLVLGLNKMRSLSKSRNKSLQHALDLPIKSGIGLKKFGFFWDGYWQKYNSETKKWENSSYKDVLKFYRALKSKNINKAKQFRIAVEKSRGHMVPYRELRERIKNHHFTEECINQFRNHINAPVYLSIFDSDSRRLNPSSTGVFTYYDAMIDKNKSQFNKELEVGSVGYTFTGASENHVVNPLIAVGVELDLWTRHVTAKFFKFGIYYPEPCFIIRVMPDQKTVKESFITEKSNYSSPQESIILLKNIIENRKIDPQNTFAFDAHGAIETNTPNRAQSDSVAHENSSGLIVRWREESLRAMRHISQSHFHTKKWADNLLKALAYKNQVSLFINGKKIKINNKNILEQMRKSILARIFKHYDAISMAKTLLEKNNMIFPKALIATLEKYDPDSITLEPLNRIKERKHKECSKSSSITTADLASIWKEIDSIDTLNELKKCLSKFISNSDVKKIVIAAKEVGTKCVAILKKRLSLNFAELSVVLMEDYFAKLELRNSKAKNLNQFPIIHKAVIENTLLNEEGGLKREFALNSVQQHNHKDIYNASPLHWAAITGNTKIVNKIRELTKSKQSLQWLGTIYSEAKNKVLPIHCALQYCIEHGVDKELLDVLLDNSIVNSKASDNKTLLLITLLESEYPIPILEILFKYKLLPYKLQGLLIDLVNKTPHRQGSSLLISLIHKDMSAEEKELLLALIEHGIDLNAQGLYRQDISINKWDKLFSNNYNEKMTYPIFAAIETGCVDLVQLLIQHGAQTSLYDASGRTLILSALDIETNQVEMVKYLCKHGLDINATCINQCCTPLHIICESSLADPDLVKLIINKSINLEAKNPDGLTPLQIALDQGNSFLIELLLKQHVHINYLTREQTKYIRSNTRFTNLYNKDDHYAAANKFRKKGIQKMVTALQIHEMLSNNNEKEGFLKGEDIRKLLAKASSSMSYHEKQMQLHTAESFFDSTPDEHKRDMVDDDSYGYRTSDSMDSNSEIEEILRYMSEDEKEESSQEHSEPADSGKSSSETEEASDDEQDVEDEEMDDNCTEESIPSDPSDEENVKDDNNFTLVGDAQTPALQTSATSTFYEGKQRMQFPFFNKTLPQSDRVPIPSAMSKTSNKRIVEPIDLGKHTDKTTNKKSRGSRSP